MQTALVWTLYEELQPALKQALQKFSKWRDRSLAGSVWVENLEQDIFDTLGCAKLIKVNSLKIWSEHKSSCITICLKFQPSCMVACQCFAKTCLSPCGSLDKWKTYEDMLVIKLRPLGLTVQALQALMPRPLLLLCKSPKADPQRHLAFAPASFLRV